MNGTNGTGIDDGGGGALELGGLLTIEITCARQLMHDGRPSLSRERVSHRFQRGQGSRANGKSGSKRYYGMV